MLKFLSGIAFLLLIGGCSAVPTIKNPFKYPYRIVPECSGRVTDLYGNPLRGVRVRIISYGKVTSAVSDADGRFTLSPLYKWIGFQDELSFYEIHQSKYRQDESIAGKRHILFGELSLFFETPVEHFQLSGVNFFPSKYTHNKDYHIFCSYSKYMFCLYIPDWNRKEKHSPNPWDYLIYTLYKQISWAEYERKGQIRSPQTIVTFDDSFVQWLKSKAVSKEMFETASKRLDDPQVQSQMGIYVPLKLLLADPQVQAGMGVFQISTPVQ